MKKVYRVRPCSRGKYTWEVDAVVNGVRKRKFFTSQKKAKVWADLRNIELENSGLNALSVSEEMRVTIQRATVLLEPYGKSILEAVTTALPLFEAELTSRPVEHVLVSLLKAKRSDGLSDRYLRDMKNRLARFVSAFEGRNVAGIGTGELKEWLRSLPGGAVTKNNFRRLLSVFFEFAIEAEWCDENPAKKIKAFPKPHRAIGVLTPDEAARLLAAADARLKPMLAIGLFTGLRRSELLRITWGAVRLSAGLIQVDVTKTKSSSRRFVRIRQNLRAWLLGCGKFEPLSADQYRSLLEAAREAAGISEWPHNALRHSFCTYALAHERNLADLVLEMGHTNPQMIFAHYRELVTPDDAAAFWRLTPWRCLAKENRQLILNE